MDKYTPLSRQDFYSSILTYTQLPKINDFKLFKGIASNEELADFYFYDPKMHIRKPKNLITNGNTYNLLLNNLPGWETYPLRKKSIVTSTKYETAIGFSRNEKYGKVYVVIPHLRAHLAIAPCSDIWYSFASAMAIFNLSDETVSLKQFNFYVNELAHAAGMGPTFDETWLSFLDTLKQISNLKRRRIKRLSNEASCIQKILYENRNNHVEFLNSAFLPHKNNFNLLSYENCLRTIQFPNNEVWTDSTCLFIEVKKYEYLNDFQQ